MSEPVSPAQAPGAATEPLRVGVIGLGTIGGGIVTSMARRGRGCGVFDVRPDASDLLPGPPARYESPAKLAAASDVVLISVVTAQQVREVVAGPDGLLAGGNDALVIVVVATISVTAISELAALCAAQGVSLLDCGVTGGSRAAENGIMALVGGPDDVVQRVTPVLADFAVRVVHCGPLGAGMATKLSSQVVTAGRWRAVHEAVALAAACGVAPETVIDVVESSDPEGTALMGLQRLRMAGQRVDAYGRPVNHYFRNVDKDMAAAQELAADRGVALPLVDLTRAQSGDTFAWLTEPADEAHREDQA